MYVDKKQCNKNKNVSYKHTYTNPGYDNTTINTNCIQSSKTKTNGYCIYITI